MYKMANYNITFSPTGGTKKVADILAKEIFDSHTDIDLCIPEADINYLVLKNDDVCIIAVPSFGGRVPQLNIERIRKFSGNGAKAILVCVYGNRAYEDTLTELQDEAEKAGFCVISAVSAIAEHSIVRQFAKGRPDSDDENGLKGFAKQIKEKLDNKDYEMHTAIPGSHNTYKERGKSGPVPQTSDACVACGICTKGCPAGAIAFDNPKTTDGDKCISCMKCIAVCPVKAKSLDVNVLTALSERLSKVCSERKENELFI